MARQDITGGASVLWYSIKTTLNNMFTELYQVFTGKTGGQTIVGGTADADALTLQGTTSATKTSSSVLVQPDGGRVGLRTNKFSYSWGGKAREASTVIKGLATAASPNEFSLIIADVNDEPTCSFDNDGRINLFSPSGAGGIIALYNADDTPTDYMTCGHYAFGSKNDAGDYNTTAFILASAEDVSAASMDSKLQFSVMSGVDTTGGYSQPNLSMYFSALGGLSVPTHIIVSGDYYVKTNIQALNKAGNGWVPLVSRVTTEAEVLYTLSNIRNLYLHPASNVTPPNNGSVVFELTNNNTLTIKAKGSDGVVRSTAITLA